MKLPNLPKDRIIQIALAVVVVALIGFILINNKNNDEKSSLKFGETLNEETPGGAEEGTAATGTKTQPSESTAVTNVPASAGSCYPGLSAKKSQMPQGILLAWTSCASDNFQFYKLVKSSLNSSPGYPDDPVAMSSSDKNESSFIDKTVVRATTYYYRVCVLERLGKVTCGNTVSITY
jgi:hypothetical protein